MSTVPFSRQRQAPLPADIAKKLPSNLDAERSVLGAILLDNAAMASADKAGLNALHFSLEQNRKIYACMALLVEEHIPIDLPILTEKLMVTGQLEAAGGAPYIASLPDGMPRVSNVQHYAKIVIDKFQRREIIKAAYALQERAFEDSTATSAELLRGTLTSFDSITVSRKENPIMAVSYKELLTLELPKADPLIDPLVTRAGTFMLYSWSGWGKSWIATEMAFRLAKGIGSIFDGHTGPGGHWPIYGPMRTLYAYGEMHGEKIRQRVKLIAKANDTDDEFEDLAVVSKDYQRIARAARSAHSWRPTIAEDKDRKYFEDILFGEGYGFFVLDNISTLWSASREDESHQVAVLKDWFIDLNARGITILFLQHAGKGGDFLGDSAQVHILDSYVKLSHPGDYRKKEGLRVVLEIEKLREFGDPRWSVPFEATLETSPERGAQWLTRPATAMQKKIAFQMFADGAPATEVLRHLSPTGKELSRATLYRWQKAFKNNATSEATDEDE
jgi:hypothetical protein